MQSALKSNACKENKTVCRKSIYASHFPMIFRHMLPFFSFLSFTWTILFKQIKLPLSPPRSSLFKLYTFVLFPIKTMNDCNEMHMLKRSVWLTQWSSSDCTRPWHICGFNYFYFTQGFLRAPSPPHPCYDQHLCPVCLICTVCPLPNLGDFITCHFWFFIWGLVNIMCFCPHS